MKKYMQPFPVDYHLELDTTAILDDEESINGV
jgi:hypothetical protein